MKNITLYVTFFLSFLLINCNSVDDDSNLVVPITDQQFSENFGSLVNRDFIGLIVDEDDQPIVGAQVRIGNSMVVTDLNGVFSVNDAQVFSRFAYIVATKSGFIDGSRSLIPLEGKNIVKIMMLPQNVIATVQSGASSEVSLPNGTTVTFDGNFKTQSGDVYSGAVSVGLHHLDPADPHMGDKMPGMLYAQTDAGDEAMLITYGMINVKLYGSNGEKLQIATTAQIEMPVSASQPNAPSSIPLWHFDEATGYWKEEGSAVRTGNKYVGTVSHFSWWNCDYPHQMVKLTITILDIHGNPLIGTMVQLSMGEGSQVYGCTDSNGQNSGLVPLGEIFTLTVQLACGPVSYSVGPFSVDTNLPAIIIENPTQTSLEGQFLTCDGEAVTNGYMIIQGSNFLIYPISNGIINIPYQLCSTTGNITVRGFDTDAMAGTDTSTFSVVAGTNQIGIFTSNCGTGVSTALEGSYSLVVTNTTNGFVRNFPDIEYVTLTGAGYHTTTTGTWLMGQLASNTQGYNFYAITGTELVIPTQQLGNFYSNTVEGNGVVIDANQFTTNYTIGFAAGDQQYSAIYTRL